MYGLMMDYQLTLDRILEHANRLYPHKRITTKLPNGSVHRYSYADFYQRVKRLANALGKLGIKTGDRVATFAWNNYQHLEMYYGVPCSGAVCHTLNIRLSPEQLAYIVEHAEDQVVFVDGTLVPLFERVAERVNCVRHYVLVNADKSVETRLPDVLFYEDLLADAEEKFSWPPFDENQATGLCYTSGTTGLPKGVLYSHRSTYLHALGIIQANSLALTEADVVFPVVPMFHAMAWGLPYACLFAGADLVLPGPHLKPESLAQMIEEEKATVPAGVPTLWQGLYQELLAKPRDVSHIRALIVGGAAMPRSLIAAYEKELNVNVLHAWGMTETSPLGTCSRLQSQHRDLTAEQKWDIKAQQGYAIPGVEKRIVNEAGKELPWDGATMGELQVRGPWVTKSYFKTEPTAEHFTEDGWFRTGDVVTISPEGYMRITDRTKDLVKSGGEWISSVELENALMAHPNVVEAAVIAMPDDKWGERPMAAVVLSQAAEAVTGDALREHLASQFEKFWLPDKIVFIDEIPKTSVGKFDKKVLRERFKRGEWT